MATVVQDFTIERMELDVLKIVGGEPIVNASIQPRAILRAMEGFTVAAALTGSDEVIRVDIDLPGAFAYKMLTATFLFGNNVDNTGDVSELNDVCLCQISNGRSPGFTTSEAYTFWASPQGITNTEDQLAARSNGTVWEGVKVYTMGNFGSQMPQGILQSRTPQTGATPGQVSLDFSWFKPASSEAIGAMSLNCVLQFAVYDIEQVRFSTAWAYI